MEFLKKIKAKKEKKVVFFTKKIVKIYLGISLELLRAVWVQFTFRYLLVPAYTSQYL